VGYSDNQKENHMSINTTNLVIAIADHTGEVEIHAEGCNHLNATVKMYGDFGPRVPKWSHTVSAAEYGETIDEVRLNWTRWNEGCWVDKTSGCATGGRAKNHPVPADIYDPEGETREERDEWIRVNWFGGQS
jgi:hypothetical protein